MSLGNPLPDSEKGFAMLFCEDGSLLRLDLNVGRTSMNIQIFGTKKSADTRKAERFFKERGIRFQFVDLNEKGLSKGELTSVMQAVGGLNILIDEKAKDQDMVALIRYLVEEERFEKLLENQQILKQPVVRNGKQATVGYCPDVWKKWE